MDAVNLRGADLNLLVVLDALLTERHVTRAGKRLGLSQPATSNALERLRVLFEDPLLERAAGGLRPTPRAEALRPLLVTILGNAAELLGRGPPPLATLQQTVRLGIVDYGAAVYVPRLLARLARTAPGIDLVVAPWVGADEALRDAASGALDLIVSVHAPSATQLRWHLLLRERYVVALRRGHPAARRFDERRWLSLSHVLVSARGERQGPLDAALAERGLSRRVGLVVPSFLAVPPILEATDYTALLPVGALTPRDRETLIVREPPLALPGFEVALAWHPRRDEDRATRHVREELIALVTPGLTSRARRP